MKHIIVLSLLTILLLSGSESSAQESTSKFTPIFDLRIRQEVLEGVLYFTSDPDRQWVRFRTRAGVQYNSGNHAATLRLANEHRRLVKPFADPDWDELIIDQAFYAWSPDDKTTLTAGRQNIIWPGGFLVLEGHPLDGSRSIYMDGIRLQTSLCNGNKLDLFAVHNQKRDPFVLAGDANRALADTDETGIGIKLSAGNHSYAVIWKHDDDPDGVLPVLNTYTLDGNFKWGSKDAATYTLETALQYQDGIPDSDPASATTNGFNFAMEGKVKGNVFSKLDADLGFFFYGENFRTPWGRWPKWSELYIYTLLAEGGDGRVHVAAWENIAAPRFNLHYPINKSLKARWGLAYLLAPEPDWQARGLLMQTELKFDLSKSVNGHLLWEMFDAGDFHGPTATSPAHFLRWQIAYTF